MENVSGHPKQHNCKEFSKPIFIYFLSLKLYIWQLPFSKLNNIYTINVFHELFKKCFLLLKPVVFTSVSAERDFISTSENILLIFHIFKLKNHLFFSFSGGLSSMVTTTIQLVIGSHRRMKSAVVM